MKRTYLFLLLLALVASAALTQAALGQAALRNGDFRSGSPATVSRSAAGPARLPGSDWTIRHTRQGAAQVQLVRGFNPTFDPADQAVWINTTVEGTGVVQALAQGLRTATATAQVYVVAGRAALCLGSGGAAVGCAYTSGEGRWETLTVTVPAGQLVDEAGVYSAGAAQFFADDVRAGGSAAEGVPAQVTLHQNYPNPFNPQTTIRYELPEGAPVRLDVFDATGRLVRRLVDGLQEAGAHEFRFDAADLPSGAYFVRLVAQGRTHTQSMMLVR